MEVVYEIYRKWYLVLRYLGQMIVYKIIDFMMIYEI